MGKYNVIYCDPPWKYGSKELYGDKIKGKPTRRRFDALERIYPTMTVEDLQNLNVKDISDVDCALFMWVTDSHLDKGIQIMQSWGFEYKTIAFVWLKKYNTGTTCVNFAPYTLKSTEICLLGIKGRMTKYKKSNNVRQLVEAERTVHSKKPDEVRKRIVDLFGDVPKIELFAREKADGWDSWGNEIENDIEIG